MRQNCIIRPQRHIHSLYTRSPPTRSTTTRSTFNRQNNCVKTARAQDSAGGCVERPTFATQRAILVGLFSVLPLDRVAGVIRRLNHDVTLVQGDDMWSVWLLVDVREQRDCGREWDIRNTSFWVARVHIGHFGSTVVHTLTRMLHTVNSLSFIRYNI